MKITSELVTKLISTVDAGLCSGIGKPEPGKMCVEAAVCYAMGLPHSDKPTCVGDSVRAFKIRLNDSAWSSDQARAQGMRKIAVAQLGSKDIDQKEFRRLLAEKTIRRVLPIALRAAAQMNPKHAEALEAEAKNCEEQGTRESAISARKAAAAAAAAASAAAYAAYAASAASAAAAAAYAASAASAAAAAADAAKAKARDEVLRLSAEIGLEVLQELKSPGCEWLHLCE